MTDRSEGQAETNRPARRHLGGNRGRQRRPDSKRRPAKDIRRHCEASQPLQLALRHASTTSSSPCPHSRLLQRRPRSQEDLRGRRGKQRVAPRRTNGYERPQSTMHPRLPPLPHRLLHQRLHPVMMRKKMTRAASARRRKRKELSRRRGMLPLGAFAVLCLPYRPL